jgi:hypothetical protein
LDATYPWMQPPPSTVAPNAGPRRSNDVFDDTADNCSIAPDDSVSVVAMQRYREECDKMAQRQQLLLRQQQQQQQQMPAMPMTATPPGRGQHGPTPRHLNHYQPANSRRPPQAQPPPQMRMPMRQRTPAQAQAQTKPLPRLPMNQRLPPTYRSQMQAQAQAQTQAMDRPQSNTTQCTEWPKCL